MAKHKKMDEWFLDVPWGKLAMVSWGKPSNPPVLLVHGYVDSAATYIPLVNLLPSHFYYVGFDLPGNGRSDSLPGPPITAMHLVECIRQIVDQLQWDTFICIAHSMGYLIGSYYNSAFPGKVSKMVALDPPAGVGFHALVYKPELWFEHQVAGYYDNYQSRMEPRLYTYEEAVLLIARARDMTEEQAAMILSRSLAPADGGKYSLSWDYKSKKISIMSIPADMMYAILTTKAPTLSIVASETPVKGPTAEYANKIFDRLQREMKDFLILNVSGNHNLHFTHPESISEYVIEFLNRDFSIKSKL